MPGHLDKLTQWEGGWVERRARLLARWSIGMFQDHCTTAPHLLGPASMPAGPAADKAFAGSGKARSAAAVAPLTVVHVVLSLDVGGLERNVVNQVRQGRRLNQQIIVVCLERPGLLARQVESLGGRVIAMRKPPGLRWRLFGKLKALLHELRPDVVHTHQFASLLYGGRAARLARVPLVVHTQHGNEDFTRRRRSRWLGRVAGRYCRRFYCLTQDMARAVEASRIVAARKLRVICNGIDSDPFTRRHDTAALRLTLGIPDDAPVIGAVGRLAEVKRFDVLIRGFAKMRDLHPNAHLVIVGDGPLKSELSALATSLGIGPSVHFAGCQLETAPYFQLMDAFALTSRTEGLPQAAIEASFTGVPVVASRVGGLPELVDEGRTGLLFEAGNTAELAAALHRLLSEKALARQLAHAAFQKVQSRFEVGRMADEYHRDYLELLGWQPAPGEPAIR
jgi:glycosyltransferase involved in cell wall biosynthesis